MRTFEEKRDIHTTEKPSKKDNRNMMDNIGRLMYSTENIRNVSIIAHVDHGKTTLTENLLSKCGLVNSLNNKCTMDTMQEEKERGITIKSTSVSLVYDNKYLINLIDCPGHIDFSSEVTSSLRVTDGTLLIVDCIEGVCVQTETVLRESILNKLETILFLNKFDRMFTEMNINQTNNVEIYNMLKKTIDNVNSIIATYQKDDNNNNNNCLELSPTLGNIGFGSGLQGWGFTIKTFCLLYCTKFGVSWDVLMNKFWGNYYFDSKKNEWIIIDHNNIKNKLKKCGFVTFIIKPLNTLVQSILNNNEKAYKKMLTTLGILNKVETFIKDNNINIEKPKDYLKIVLRTWLPIADVLFEMMIEHLPNPIESQSLRMDTIYNGNLDSKEFDILKKCQHNNNTPMTFYISKFVPTTDNSRFIAFGRVFSGVIRTGQEVYILDPNNTSDSSDTNSVLEKKRVKIQKCFVMMAGKHEIINHVPCGNVCGILGLDNYINKSGTIVEVNVNEDYEFMPFKVMNYNVSPIVEMAVHCVKASDLPKLNDALRKLNKFDNLVQIKRSETGENIIAAAGELHLETCVNTLKNVFLSKQNCDIKLSDPIVNYNETIINNDGKLISVSKSANKLNRLYCSAQSLSIANDAFVNDLDKNSLYFMNLIKNSNIDGLKQFANEFETKYNNNNNNNFLHKQDILKIWSFGCIPHTSSFTNILCDVSKGVDLLKDIKHDIINGFEQVTLNGVLCNEQLRGVKFNVIDAKIHSDKAHRNGAAIIPMTKRVLYACQLGNGPRLMEPIYKVEIVVKKCKLNNVINTLQLRRGNVINIETSENIQNSPLLKIDGTLPVSESFGFTNLLRQNTQGEAFPNLKFSHWSIVNFDPFIDNNDTNSNTNNNMAKNIILNIRQRKGLKCELPNYNDYFDKIN